MKKIVFLFMLIVGFLLCSCENNNENNGNNASENEVSFNSLDEPKSEYSESEIVSIDDSFDEKTSPANQSNHEKSSAPGKKITSNKFNMDDFIKNVFSGSISGPIQKGNWIYYIDVRENSENPDYIDYPFSDHTLKKIRIDGKKDQKIHEYVGEIVSVLDGWIYYYDYAHENPGFNRIKTDGKKNIPTLMPLALTLLTLKMMIYKNID